MEIDNCLSKTLTSIPDHLIFANILPRLPVKSLLRFKSVCKSWNSVICTLQFTISHLQFSSSLSPHFLLQDKDYIYTLAYNDNRHDNLKEPVKLEQPWDYSIDIVGCCNGLICFYVFDNSENCYLFWNPATRQHRKIHTPIANNYSSLVTHGFGYCSTEGVDDYKIISSLSAQNCLWVLSLRTGLWKTIDFPTDYPFFGVQHMINCTRIVLGDTLYWDVWDSDRISICCLSLIDEQFDQETPLLIPANEISYDDSYLCVFKGCLSFIWQRPDHYDVFVLKKEGHLTSWEKLFSIPFVSDVRFVDFAIPGKCLVIKKTSSEGPLPNPWSGELKLVDPTLEALEHSRGISYELGYIDSVQHYVESLVSPSSFTLM